MRPPNTRTEAGRNAGKKCRSRALALGQRQRIGTVEHIAGAQRVNGVDLDARSVPHLAVLQPVEPSAPRVTPTKACGGRLGAHQLSTRVAGANVGVEPGFAVQHMRRPLRQIL